MELKRLQIQAMLCLMYATDRRGEPQHINQPQKQMNPSQKAETLASRIERTSPLYDYWKSEQDENDQKARLAMASLQKRWSAAAELFKKEPYKWETLYQSIIRELINAETALGRGDTNAQEDTQASARGLKVMLAMLSTETRERTLDALAEKRLFNEQTLAELKQSANNNFADLKTDTSPKKKNPGRFARILFAIFTNPYDLELKGRKEAIYERTGALINTLRKTMPS